MAAEYAAKDGGPMIKIGYEGLSWALRNTLKSTWEVVEAANRPNVGLIIDSFNVLAVEYANPYNSSGHGRVYNTEHESLVHLKDSLTEFVANVDSDRIFFCQLADAECVDPLEFKQPNDPSIPRLLPWSRGHRLFPCEKDRGAYMPVELVTAALLATGYKGPLSLEVFNKSLHSADSSVPLTHATRGLVGLKKLCDVVPTVAPFWLPQAPTSHTKYTRCESRI
jgi:sugar phosphate isomerase/epimerase